MRIRVAERRKLLDDDEEVEVRSTEDGFLGSWHPGTVISSQKGFRLVKYHNILSDNTNTNNSYDQDCCAKLVDSVNVSDFIDGISSNAGLVLDYRGLIRPVPPFIDMGVFKYGQCVDVNYMDAWWEGVIFDCCDGFMERSVFIPDMGDELKVDAGGLRVSQDWDECSGVWKVRGRWVFLDVIDEFVNECGPIVVSVKQIWYDIRVKKGFDENAKKWTCLRSDVWRKLLLEVLVDNFKITMKEFLMKMKSLGQKGLEECYRVLELNGPDFYALMKSKAFDEISGGEVVSVVESGRLDTLPLSSSIKPMFQHEAPCVSPPKMAALASNIDDQLSKNESCNSSCTVSKENKHRVWVSGDVVPEYCANAIEEYSKVYCKSSRTRCDLHVVTLNLRKHLVFLGWKAEYFQDKGFRRWRYTQPDGSKKYFSSLFTVCQHFRKSDSAKVSMLPRDEHNRLSDAVDHTISSPLYKQSQGCRNEPINNSPDDDNGLIEPEYCPQAVINYYSHEIKEKVHPRDHDKNKDMQLRAKKHLSAVGWKLYHTYKNNTRSRELRYCSPCGKLYVSLRSACKGYFDEERNVLKLAEAQLAGEGPCFAKATKEVHGKREKKRKRSALYPASCSQSKESLKKGKKSTEVQARDNLNCSFSDRVLGSRKRAREVMAPSSYHSNPRTVLSWLIDNNMILPRQKVLYKRDDKKMAEGRVTRDGIKCRCCQEIFSVSNFEVHAIGTRHQPSANIFLEGGKSLQEYQMELRREINARGSTKEVKGNQQDQNKEDNICSVCHFGGDLILCDGCPSSFHECCLGLKENPDGYWFCPSCCCKICGRGENKGSIEVLKDNSVMKCHQCELQYHIGCLRMKDLVLESHPKGYWFCNKKCEHISLALQKLLGKPIQVGTDNLTWTLLKYVNPDECDHEPSSIADSMENYCKLNVALDVMHECFEPVKEPWTRRDLVEDVIFNRWSKLKRLNFRGFYTVLLERNDELIAAATVRIHGEKVAEIPLVATRFIYRRRGMCRILMNELEKVLREVGVERLVLPAVPSVLNTWISSFGFSRMPQSERLKLLDYTFLDFQGTTMCQKLLKAACTESSPPRSVKHYCGVANGNANMDLEGSISVSGSNTGGINKVGSFCLVSSHQKAGFPSIPCQSSEIILENPAKGTDYKEDEKHGNDKIRCYKRRRISKSVGAHVSAC